MTTYPALETGPTSISVTIDGSIYQIRAVRESPTQMPVVSLTGTRYVSPYRGPCLQVHFLSYRREDGAIVHGRYLGNIIELVLAPEKDTK